MRAIMVMFDTLSRNYLSTYGNTWCHTPNFERLQQHCCVMDTCYAGSLPCMPARRELHTGKYNFLHRSWGPLEPFDFSAIQAMSDAGIYTHLCTDHSHYFEDGGATYHNRYCTWEGFRGQEGDRWVPRSAAFQVPEQSPLSKKGISVLQHAANKSRQLKEEDMSGVKTIQAGLQFLEEFKNEDQWFLQIECFDPHEPFYVPDRYRNLYQLPKEVTFNWPAYAPVDETKHEDELREVRQEYAALITMCDTYLGKILDVMDANNMWEDTMLIVNTDHGFLLGEHGYMGKNFWPMHQEVAHIPCYIHVPSVAPARRDALCQTIDLAPTLLDYFHLDIPENMDGKSLLPVVRDNQRIHDYALFGAHGGQVNITDGSYVYMKSSAREDNQPYVECTLMPTMMRGFMNPEHIRQAELAEGDRYSNGVPYLKIPSATYLKPNLFPDSLWDVRETEIPVENREIQEQMERAMAACMRKVQAPQEEFERLGLKKEDLE